MGQLVGFGILVLLVVAAIPLYRRNKRVFKAHNDDMQTWAASHGYDYAFEDNSQFEGLSFYPFGVSDHQEAHRVITGTYAERGIAVYDFDFLTSGGSAGGGGGVYFAMIVMQLPTRLPWLQVADRKNLSHHDEKKAISTGDEEFDSAYALFAEDQDYAKSAVSATVRAGLPAQSLSSMRIVGDRLFLWQNRRKHDVARLEDRLRFAATLAAELPAPT